VNPLTNFIAGSFVASHGNEVRQHFDPSHNRVVLSSSPRGSSRDTEDGVSAAAEALNGWRETTAATRAEYLHRWATVITSHAERMAQALVREVGKPVTEARGEVSRAVVILRYYAAQAVQSAGEVIPAQTAVALQYSLREPLGVVALITPWNFPLAIPLWKAAPALAFGNTVVLKPSEHSPYAAWLLAETALEAGLPRGTFNVVQGDGAVAGESLMQNSLVQGISFTGSHTVGARVAEVAAGRNIRYQTEMGGKNVAIVLADGDLERAATLTAAGGVRYAGQKRTATSRVVVANGVAERFHGLLGQRMQEMVLGPVSDSSCAVGPLIHQASRDKVLRYLSAVSEAEVFGGEVPTSGELASGNFLRPALVRGVSPTSAIAQEEVFGPVIVSFAAEDLEHALHIANGTSFGLSASLFTSDIASALHYVRRIDAGMVRVNGDTTGVDPHAPFGGMKFSSSGTREQGTAAREFYTATKTVQINP
jgi:aldehyde dehydrogenase (NAD+)